MERNNKGNQPQASQVPRLSECKKIEPKNNSEQLVDSSRKSANANLSNNGNIERSIFESRSVPKKDNPIIQSRVNQTHEAAEHENNDNSWVHSSNRRRGQHTGRRSDRGGIHRDSYANQERTGGRCYSSSEGIKENRNGKRPPMRSGNQYRFNTRGQSWRRGSDSERMKEVDDLQNLPVSNTVKSSQPFCNEAETPNSKVLSGNVWSDKTKPVSKLFENPALKGLVPESKEEENEMYQLALKRSLEEKHVQRGNLRTRHSERKCSTSSEADTFLFDEAIEAKKMLQSTDFPPLPASIPVGLSTSVSENVSQTVSQEPLRNIISNLNDLEMNHISSSKEKEAGRSSLETWDKFGARPKEKNLPPVGRGVGRGRKASEGKIGELITPAVKVPQSTKSVASTICSEQFVPTNIIPNAVISEEKDLGVLQNRILAQEGSSLEERLPKCDTSPNSAPRNSISPVNAENSLINACIELDCAEAEPKLIVIQNPSTECELQHSKSPTLSPTEKNEHSKDEEIRALKEEVDRLKKDSNRENIAPFMQPYGVPFVSMPLTNFYHYTFPAPFPAMAVPVIPRDSGGIAESSYPSMPIMPVPPNALVGYPQGAYQLQPTISAPCVDTMSVPLEPNVELTAANNPMSDLSPNAAEFFPSQVPVIDPTPGFTRRSERNFTYYEDRPPSQNSRCKQQQMRGSGAGQMSRGISRHSRGQSSSFPQRLPRSSVGFNSFDRPSPFASGRTAENPALMMPGVPFANRGYVYRPNY